MIPALSVVVAGLAMGAREEAGPLGADARDLGFLDRFVDADGYFSIGYLGSPGNAFPVIPYGEIYNGAVDKPFYRENEFFKGKIVLLGDTTTIGSDDFRTPVGNMPGVEVHAHAIATLLNGRSVREEPWSRNFVALCLLVVLACPLAAVWPLRRAALATVALLMGYFILNVWLFVDRGIWLHLVAPCSAVVLATLGVLTERGLTEEREKDRMRGLLHRYISPQIASHIIADPEGYVLGGERVTATVLFADVRGFSRMSAQLPPEQVVSWLNDHFQWMTHIIFRHDGAVDKYMGDAVMALFGVPVPHPDHALRAVSAAIDLQNELLQRRQRVPSDDRPPIDFGIGISTGEMVVGNVGTTERLDFTAIGDAVNLAARVEGLSRERRCRIHVTESTYRLVSNDVRARGPLTATVKDTTAVVYEVFGWRDPATPAGALDLEPFVAHGNEAGQERE